MIGKCLTKSGGSDNPWVISQASDMEKYRNKDYEGQFIKYTGPQTNEYKPGTYQVAANPFKVGDTVNNLYYSFSNTEVTQNLLKNLYNDIASTGTMTNESGRWFTYFFDDYLVQRNYTLLKFDNGKELVMTWLYGQEGRGSTIKHDEYYLGYGTRTDYQAQPRNSLVVVVDGDTVKTVNNTEVLSKVQYINQNEGPVNKYVYKNSAYAYNLDPVYNLAKLGTPAVNNDIIPGKEAYDDNGNKLTGNLKSYNNPLKPTSQEEYDAIIAGNDYLNNYIEFNSKTTKTEVGEYSGTWAMGDRVTAIYFDTSKTPEKPTDWSRYDHSMDVGSIIKFKTLMSGDVNAPIGIPRGLFWGNGRVSDGTNATFIMDSTSGAIIWSDAKVTSDDDAGWQYSVLTGDLKNKLEIDPDYAYTLTIISDSYNWNGVYTYKNSPAKEVKTYYPLDPLTNAATASEVAKDKEVYDGEGNKIVGTYELRLQEKTATPGLNPQNILPDNGYTGLSKVMVDGVGITPSKTVTPGTVDIHVEPDAGDLGIESVLVGGDADLLPENIKQGVSIFNVEGTLVPGGPDAGKLKLGKPICAIDWDTDKLVIFNNPYTSWTQRTQIELDIDGNKTYPDNNNGSGRNEKIDPFNLSYFSENIGANTDVSTISVGSHVIKAKSTAANAPDIKIKETGEMFEKPVGYLDSDYSNEIVYERWNYNINLDSNLSEYYTGSLTGVLNNHKYCTGTLTNSKIGGPIFTNSSESQTYGFDLDGDILTSTNAGISSSFSYAKISFTLSTDTEITLQCRSYGERGYDYGIVSKIDMELSKSDIDDGNTGSGSVLYNFRDESSPNWVDVSFGTVSAGAHYFTLKYRKDGGGNSFDDNFKVKIPSSLFEILQGSFYLPLDITVVAENGKIPEYTYDPYTGKFSIPMVGNIVMTAASTDTPLLDKLTITPSTWDVHTSILTWDYSVPDAVYHIETPDGQEYTTTEKQYNFTGKLGAASSDYKKIKIWAVKNSQQSGICIINLIYNPTDIFFKKSGEITLDKNIKNNKYWWNYNNDVYLFSYVDTNMTVYKWNFELNTFSEDFKGKVSQNAYSVFGYFTVDNILYVNSNDYIYAINVETKTITEALYTTTLPYRLRSGIQRGNLLYWWDDSYGKIYYCNKDLSDLDEHKAFSGSVSSKPRYLCSSETSLFIIDYNSRVYKLDEENKTIIEIQVDGKSLTNANYIIETDTEYRILIHSSDRKKLIYVDKATLTKKSEVDIGLQCGNITLSSPLLRTKSANKYFIAESYNAGDVLPLYYFEINNDSVKLTKVGELHQYNFSIATKLWNTTNLYEYIMPEYNGIKYYDMIAENTVGTVI